MDFSKAEANEMLLLVKQLADSKALGRSQVYAKLLRYLANQSIQGKACTEYAVAIDVFDKNDDYDVSVDSTVRVYIYNLRKKLETYYADKGRNETKQLCLPKGEYRLIVKDVVQNDATNLTPPEAPVETPAINPDKRNLLSSKQLSFFKLTVFSIGLILLTVLITLVLSKSTSKQTTSSTFSEQQVVFWGEVLNDEKPVMLVIGDYFMFGESANKLNEKRLIRELDVNSTQDLLYKNEALSLEQKDVRFDLGLTYLPSGSAHAIAKIQQLLQPSNKIPTVRMMSELNSADLRMSHIIYIGHLNGLGILEDYIASNSRFIIGINHDVIVDTKSDQLYSNSIIDAKKETKLVDYGILSSFPLTKESKLVILTGTGDVGLKAVADIAINKDIMNLLKLNASDKQVNMATETLFQVTNALSGIDSQLLISDYQRVSNIDVSAKGTDN